MLFSGERGQLPDVLEDLPVPGAQGERGEHLEGRRRRQVVPRRAGEVPHHGRVQKEAERLSQVSAVACFICF